MTRLHLPRASKLFLVAVFICLLACDKQLPCWPGWQRTPGRQQSSCSSIPGVYRNRMSFELPAEYSWVNPLNVAHWQTPEHCIPNSQTLSKFLTIRNNKLQLSQATDLSWRVAPVFLNVTVQLAMNVLFWMGESTRKIEGSSFTEVYMGLNTSLSVTVMQSLPSRFLATLLSFLLSPATKINKMGANGVMGSWKSTAHSFYHLETMCSAKKKKSWWRLGFKGAVQWPDKPSSQAPIPGAHPRTHPCPAHMLPITFSFHAMNINPAVGGFSTIVSLGRSCYIYTSILFAVEETALFPYHEIMLETNIEIDKIICMNITSKRIIISKNVNFLFHGGIL